MYILGISGGFRSGNMDSAACLIHKNEIVAAAEEERFIRIKHAPGVMPQYAIRYCLEEAGIRINDVDTLVFAGATYADIQTKIKRYFNFRFGFCPPLYFVEHHLAHASSAFFISGFESASILTMDLSGDGISTLLAYGKQAAITKIREFPRPNSLGAFYNILTQYLGFNRNNDEYKVMGLAAYGKPRLDLSWLLKRTSDGYKFNQEAIVKIKKEQPFPSMQEPLYGEKFLKHFSPPRIPGSPINQYHMDFAASGQKLLEDIICHLAKTLYAHTGSRNMCIAGGVGLNCVANARVRLLPFIDNIFVPPVASDAGLAMGCALKIAIERGFKFGKLSHAYYGPSFSNKKIEVSLKHIKCEYKYCENISSYVAQKISQGYVVGWFQGRMEYGPRALGNRSILADPRRKGMKDKINHIIKFRESFRPFAPSVLQEYVRDFFVKAMDSPFMTLNFDVIKKKQNQIPSVIHVDGTSRVQVVSKDINKRYYKLIDSYRLLTGMPLVLNTSFNIKEEPIVCSPYQAVATFFESGLDILAIGDFLLKKKGVK